MGLKVLVIPDKFKGTLTALAAAQAIARGWRQGRPQDQVDWLPMSDGGDGFGEMLSQALQGVPQTVSTVDAAHRPLAAAWWWVSHTQTAILEAAQVIGLALLPAGRFHPFQLDTFGLGAVLQGAAAKGARRCLIGIGGSATNDAGFGLARSLGWQFRDQDNKPIEIWTKLTSLVSLTAPAHRQDPVFTMETVVAVDVQNRLLGPQGATRIYGPQKGLTPEDIPTAECALERLAALVRQTGPSDPAQERGSGAAGGLGFGLRSFLGARLEPGFDLFARQTGLAKRMQNAQLIITAEGALDRSTVMGKGVGEIARLSREMNLPCLGLAGMVEDSAEVRSLFTTVDALVPELTDAAEAKARPGFYLEQLAAQVAKRWPDPVS